MKRRLTAIIEREGDGFVSLCPELDIASQGDTVESARENLPRRDRTVPRMRFSRGGDKAIGWRGLRYTGRGGWWVSSVSCRVKGFAKFWLIMDSSKCVGAAATS